MITIARLTLMEMSKKKILYISIVFSILFLGLYSTAMYYAYDSLPKEDAMVRFMVSGQIISTGIYFSTFIIAFLAIFSSCGIISSDREVGTYDAVLSKAISRTEVIMGKFLGLVSVLVIYTISFYVLIIGLNMYFGKGVVANLNMVGIIKSTAMLCLLPVILSAIGMFLSISMSTMSTGITLSIIYFCGMIGGILEQIGQALTTKAGEALINTGIVTSLLIPTDIIYRKASTLLFEGASGRSFSLDSIMGVSVQPSPLMIYYIVFYIVLMVAASVYKFKKLDI